MEPLAESINSHNAQAAAMGSVGSHTHDRDLCPQKRGVSATARLEDDWGR